MNSLISTFYETLMICRPSDPAEFAARFFEDERVARSGPVSSNNSGSLSSAYSPGTAILTGPSSVTSGGVAVQPLPPVMILHAMQALPYVINEDTWFVDFSCKLFLFLTDAERAMLGPRSIKLIDASAFVQSLAQYGYAPSLPPEIRRHINGSVYTDSLTLRDFTNFLRLSLRAALLCHIVSALIGAAQLYYSASGSATTSSRIEDERSIDAGVLQSVLPHPCIAPYMKMFSSILNLPVKSTGRDEADREKEALAALNAVLGKYIPGRSVGAQEVVLGLLTP